MFGLDSLIAVILLGVLWALSQLKLPARLARRTSPA